VLAFASIGFMVRRDGRGALERLGLTALRPAGWLIVIAGVVALWLFNVGSEALEKSVFPALWASDQAFTAGLASVMGPGLMLLLSLSAGIGEEITLRGALQPKLGIALTSLLFAALHVQYSWYGMLSILVFGLLLGVIRQRGSTTAAILVHTLYNLLAVASAKP
jgi:membrane protease YdiL (CAAX protease family)